MFKQRFFEIEIFCNIISVFTVSFVRKLPFKSAGKDWAIAHMLKDRIAYPLPNIKKTYI